MLKSLKRRIISSITALAIVFSFGAVNAMDVYEAEDGEATSIKLKYDHIEELADGGKIYVYVIDGAEHRFPVPPEGFTPLTATDEQLETYGFPPRPDEENQEDYEAWVKLMSNYKFTQAPELEMSEKPVEDNENISPYAAGDVNHPQGVNVAGYYFKSSGSKFHTQVQGDFVYPNISKSVAGSRDSFWLGFGDPSFGKTICAGITTICTSVGTSSTAPWYGYRPSGSIYIQEFRFSGFRVNPGDNIHIYISYQKANNSLSYYFSNNTTGETKSSVVNISASTYFDGSTVGWVVERRPKPVGQSGFYYLGNFGTVTFKNCKAMYNNSTSWTNMGSLEGKKSYAMIAEQEPVSVSLGNIVSGNQFSCTWYAGG